MQIVMRKTAQKDLKQIRRYRYRNAKLRGEEFVLNLVKYIQKLSIFPEMGRMLLPQYSIRKLIYQKYIILYQIDYSRNLIRIIKIVQPSQDINLVLKNIINYL